MNHEAKETKIGAEVALDDLAKEATTPADHAELAAWRAEIAADRAQAVKDLGTSVLGQELVILGDGTVTTKDAIEGIVAEGPIEVGPYQHSSRS